MPLNKVGLSPFVVHFCQWGIVMLVTIAHHAHVAPSCGSKLLWSVVDKTPIVACALELETIQPVMFRGTLHSQNNKSLMSGSAHPSSGEGDNR